MSGTTRYWKPESDSGSKRSGTRHSGSGRPPFPTSFLRLGIPDILQLAQLHNGNHHSHLVRGTPPAPDISESDNHRFRLLNKMAIATLAPPPVDDGAHASSTSGGSQPPVASAGSSSAPPSTGGDAPSMQAGTSQAGGANIAKTDASVSGGYDPKAKRTGDSFPKNPARGIASNRSSRSSSVWSQPAPSPVLGGGHFLSRAEADRICLPGVIPASTTSLSMGAPIVPVSWDVPPHFSSGATQHLVGVPATEASLERGSRVYNGCGGLETPLLFESLSSDDVSDLEALERDAEARSVTLHCELASILAHFSPERLAERTYNMVSFLRRLLVKVRDLQQHVQHLGSGQTSNHALWLQDEKHALEREWTAMCQYWQRHVRDVKRQSSETVATRTRLFRNVEESMKRRVQKLQDENSRLRDDLQAARAAQEQAEQRADSNTLDPDELMDFLMRDESGVTVISNWERLRDIFRHYADGTTPPPSWNTQINVTAMDNVRYMPPDYVKPEPRPKNPRGGGGGSGARPSSTPRPTTVLDLTGSGSSKTQVKSEPKSQTQSKSGSKRKASQQSGSDSKRSARKLDLDLVSERQVRPKDHQPRNDLACGPDTDLDLAMEADAQKLVPEGLLWIDLRQDVRQLMVTGLTFDGTMKLLHSGKPVHHLLPGYMVQLMLAQMIDWEALDTTPWSKFVPESDYLAAERVWTGIRIEDGRELEKWPPLDKCIQKLQERTDAAAEIEMITGSLFESSDDEDGDPSFSLKPAAVAAGAVLEAKDEAEALDDDADEIPSGTEVVDPKVASQAGSETRRISPRTAKRSKTAAARPDTKVVKKSRTSVTHAKGGCHPTDLAAHEFETLDEDELTVVEVCDRETTSTFRIFGVKMKFSDKFQTLGFPDYEPHKHETKYLKDRWSIEVWDEFMGVVRQKKSGTKRSGVPGAGAYDAGPDSDLWETVVLDFILPWVQMFEDRSKEFYFHRVQDLSSAVLDGIKEFLKLMEEHAEGWWYILHWFTISVDQTRSKELHLRRRKCRETLVRNFLSLVARLKAIPNFPATMWYEPGLWILPDCLCYWVFKDPSVNFKTASGVADLHAELVELDEREPARTQWADAMNETAHLERVPEAFVKKRLLPKIERVKNLLPIPDPPAIQKP